MATKNKSDKAQPGPEQAETSLSMAPSGETGDQDCLALAFRALGDPVRIRIYDFLRTARGPVAVHRKSGEVRSVEVGEDSQKPANQEKTEKRVEGITVGDVVMHLASTAKTASTVSHHLKELRQAGLIRMQRQGKHMICSVNPPALDRLSAFLADRPGATLPSAEEVASAEKPTEKASEPPKKSRRKISKAA